MKSKNSYLEKYFVTRFFVVQWFLIRFQREEEYFVSISLVLSLLATKVLDRLDISLIEDTWALIGYIFQNLW